MLEGGMIEHGLTFGTELCAVFGIDTKENKVRAIEIQVIPEDFVTVTVTYLVEEEQAHKIHNLLLDYELVRKEE
jgi:hypothetical protein